MHKMNAKKSADYCNLIENVKNKYRKNPIYAKNLTLGWCDLCLCVVLVVLCVVFGLF